MFGEIRRRLKLKKPQYVFAICVLAPIIAIYTIIRIIPITGTIFLGFQKWDLISPVRPFIGLRNYINLVHDELFIIAIRNTFILALFSIVISLGIALGLALILNRRKMRFAAAYELIYFLPFVISWVPLAVIWKWMYDPSYGIFNYVIGLVGVEPQGWLVNPKLSLYSIIILVVWRTSGLNTVLFSVGLKNIPAEYIDAAILDGAGHFKLFKNIILPLLKPIILYLVIMSTILNFAIFAPVYVMTLGSQGAPGNAVRVLVLDLYENGFRYFHMGYAAAEAGMLLLIVLVLASMEFWLIRYEV